MSTDPNQNNERECYETSNSTILSEDFLQVTGFYIFLTIGQDISQSETRLHKFTEVPVIEYPDEASPQQQHADDRQA